MLEHLSCSIIIIRGKPAMLLRALIGIPHNECSVALVLISFNAQGISRRLSLDIYHTARCQTKPRTPISKTVDSRLDPAKVYLIVAVYSVLP